MSEYRLTGFAESGNCYKAALGLELAGADWEAVVETKFMEGVSRTPDWRAANNAMGEVPILEHGTRKLSQSGVILDYIAQTTGKFGWSNDDERREILRWILFDNHKFTGVLSLIRWRRAFMNAHDEITAYLAERFESAIGVVEDHVSKNDWIALGKPTIADVSLAGYVYFDGEHGLDWSKYPATDAWRGRVAALDKWRAPYDLLPRLREPASA